MALRSSRWLERIFQILRSVAVLLIAGCVAVISLVWCYHFYPNNRKEVVGPGKGGQRSFTENCGFNDITILLRASDWPWTFRKPVTLGELYWPEVQRSSSVAWSKDGSVVALLRHLNEDQSALFSAAYDYNEHRLIETGYGLDARLECDRMISTLLSERGGTGPFQSRLDDEKVSASEYEAFPGWGCIAPAVFMLGGVIAAWRLGRR